MGNQRRDAEGAGETGELGRPDACDTFAENFQEEEQAK
jgi:hypothetical protein